MAIPILVIGKSGVGKSASLRNFPVDQIGVLNVLGKPLPFRNPPKTVQTTDYEMIKKMIIGSKAKSIVIDDAGYLVTDQFMTGHSSAGKGNAVFTLYNEIADKFYELLRFVVKAVPPDKIVYVIMHEEKSDMGDVKPKTIGKLLDEKVCVEGLFTIVLRAMKKENKYLFRTQSDGYDVAKSPIGMFEDIEIDNDLKLVDDTIRDYYNIKSTQEVNNEKA